MGFLGPMEGAGGWLGACGCVRNYNLAELRVLRAIMALSGFGQSPTAGGKANAWHMVAPGAAPRLNEAGLTPRTKPPYGIFQIVIRFAAQQAVVLRFF